MNHPRKCDCARCRLPTKFYDYLGLDVKYDDPEEKNRRIFDARQKQEERVLLRIGSTGDRVLYMGSKNHLNNEDGEVEDVLADILTRFFAGSEYFSTLEIQIAGQELNHTINQQRTPADALLRLVMGSVINFISRPRVQNEVKILLKSNNGDDNIPSPDLMESLNTAYNEWLKEARATNNLWLVRFAKDRTSTLVDPAQDNQQNIALPMARISAPNGFSKLPDSEIREIMVRNEADEKMKHPEIFNTRTGSNKGRLRPPYWPVAFATDDKGRRYLSDRVLGAILPSWDDILRGKAKRSFSGYKTNWINLASEFDKWKAREGEKLDKLGVEWPAPYEGRRPDFGDPGLPSQVWYKVKPAREASDDASNADNNGHFSAEAPSSEFGGSYQDRSNLSSRAQSPAPSGVSNPFVSRQTRLSGAGEGSSHQPSTSNISSALSQVMEGLSKLNQRMELIERVQRGLQNLRVRDGEDPIRSASPAASRASSRWAPSEEPRSSPGFF